jgi:hypothetical protein
VTEAEWLNCTEPGPMLEFLHAKVSARKLRLFACACCRRVWHLLTDEPSRAAVEFAERVADGADDGEGLYLAIVGAETVANARAAAATDAADMAASSAAFAARNTMLTDAAVAADYCSANVASAAYHAASVARVPSAAVSRAAERFGQVRLLCEMFGNPFRPVPSVADWVAWNDGTLRRIAHAIDAERAFERLPILADALEDAGCDDADILNHCRKPGEHVRGCWVVDLLSGKS